MVQGTQNPSLIRGTLMDDLVDVQRETALFVQALDLLREEIALDGPSYWMITNHLATLDTVGAITPRAWNIGAARIISAIRAETE